MDYEVNLYKDSFQREIIHGKFPHLPVPSTIELGRTYDEVALKILKTIPEETSRLTVINNEKYFSLDASKNEMSPYSAGISIEREIFDFIKDELFKKRKDLTYISLRPASF
ncbi:MAG: hypothetical protein PVJ67_01290 [Candidatus Pacearchaeota archaeon]|jgi:hypothetical protein